MKVPMVPISDFCQTGSGITPSRQREDYYGGNIPWVKSGELRETEILQTEECLTSKALDETSIKIVPAGALLVAMYGATVGRVGILGVPATTNQAVCHIVPDAKKADTRYLFHALQQKAQDFVRHGVGGAQPNISQRVIRDAQVFLPPLDEQKRIAAILDQADTLRRLRQRAINRLNELGQAVFYEMFIANQKENWPIKTVGEIALQTRTGPFGSQLLHSEFTESGIPVLGIDNAVHNEFRWGVPRFITEEKYRELSRYTVKPGDVLITIMGTCGRCAIVPEGIPKAINTKHLCCITLDKRQMLPQFLHAAFLEHPEVIGQLGVQAKGAVMPGLNTGIIRDLSIRVPPLERQAEFAKRTTELKFLRDLALAQDLALDKCFAALQHRAFTNQL